jgi:hypothetical protein
VGEKLDAGGESFQILLETPPLSFYSGTLQGSRFRPLWGFVRFSIVLSGWGTPKTFGGLTIWSAFYFVCLAIWSAFYFVCLFLTPKLRRASEEKNVVAVYLKHYADVGMLAAGTTADRFNAEKPGG